VVLELVGNGTIYRAGQCFGVQWDLYDGSLAMDRTYIATNVTHELRNGAWRTVLTGIQVSREDAL